MGAFEAWARNHICSATAPLDGVQRSSVERRLRKSARRLSLATPLRSRGAGGRCAWLTFWFATTSAPSAKCSTSPCAAKATGWRRCKSGQTAKNKIDGALYDVIITDIKMPNIDGIEVLAPRAPGLARLRRHPDYGGR